ncbi:MAG: S24 family peptidase, partial [Eubacterium sp.]|nr:S24 family peptidase [Eubacterium sp.]
LDQISTLAAAGDGYFFSDFPVEDYFFVFKDDRNKNANGIFRVKGRSMEPVYHDGDSVYVRYTESADVGEDVIISSKEGIHIKRLGDDGVYSLNKMFPFTPDGEVRIVGKVLGIVSANDLPKKEDLPLLEQIRHDEIREFKEKYGTE